MYELSSDADGDDDDDVVVKVARVCTTDVQKSFAAERTALTILESVSCNGLVPALVGHGTRDGNEWPILLLRPLGIPLSAWVTDSVQSASMTTAAKGSAMRGSCALRAVLGVLDALAAAHAMGIIHCDVRPSNIVVVGGKAMLVDWGSSRKTGENASCVGVPDFAQASVFDRAAGGFKANTAQDVAGALYTWLTVAFVNESASPWRTPALDGGCSDHAMYSARDEWIEDLAKRDETVARVQRALKDGTLTIEIARNALTCD